MALKVLRNIKHILLLYIGISFAFIGCKDEEDLLSQKSDIKIKYVLYDQNGIERMDYESVEVSLYDTDKKEVVASQFPDEDGVVVFDDFSYLNFYLQTYSEKYYSPDFTVYDDYMHLGDNDSEFYPQLLYEKCSHEVVIDEFLYVDSVRKHIIKGHVVPTDAVAQDYKIYFYCKKDNFDWRNTGIYYSGGLYPKDFEIEVYSRVLDSLKAHVQTKKLSDSFTAFKKFYGPASNVVYPDTVR